MTLAAGSRLGRYEILGPLGAGGMGEVYRARNTELERDVAIKVLPEAVAQDPDRLARFELVDQSREEAFSPGTPRRIPTRAWFPAESVSGEPRPFVTELELEHQIQAFSDSVMPTGDVAVELRKDLPTHSYESAVPIGDGPVPTVIFNQETDLDEDDPQAVWLPCRQHVSVPGDSRPRSRCLSLSTGTLPTTRAHHQVTTRPRDPPTPAARVPGGYRSSRPSV